MDIQERYSPEVIPVNGAYIAPSGVQNTGCFLAVTGGTLTIVLSNGKVMLNAMPVAAGSFYKIPFHFGGQSWSVTCAGGASGLLGVAS